MADLSFNKLTALPAQLSALNGLETLDLSGNAITFHEGFVGLSMLKTLILARNGIKHLTDDIFQSLMLLEILILRENNITSIGDGTFRPLEMLDQLDLSRNSLTSLRSTYFQDLHALTLLDLTGNNISSYSTEGPFLQMRNVKSLHMGNVMEKIDDNLLEGLDSLATLFIVCYGDKPLHITAEAFSNRRKLTSLYFIKCNLRDLTIEWVSYISEQLLVLSLSQCHVENFPPGFAKRLPYLKVLDLNSNAGMKSLPDLTGMFHLEYLILRGTNIDSLYPCHIGHLKHLQLLDLVQTPLKCDCDSAYLAHLYKVLYSFPSKATSGYMEQLAKAGMTPKQWICSSPDDLQRRSLGALHPIEFQCPGRKTQIQLFCPKGHPSNPHFEIEAVANENTIALSWDSSIFDAFLVATHTGTVIKGHALIHWYFNSTTKTIKKMHNVSYKEEAYTITDLKDGTDYEVCIDLVTLFVLANDCTVIRVGDGEAEPEITSGGSADVSVPIKILVAAGVLVILMIIVFVITAIICWRKKRRSQSYIPSMPAGLENKNYKASGISLATNMSSITEGEESSDGAIYDNVNLDEQPITPRVITFK